jgi:hypothetical protein
MVAGRDHEIGALRSMVALREEALQNLHRDLDGVLASRSWRVTAVIRALGAVLRRH